MSNEDGMSQAEMPCDDFWQQETARETVRKLVRDLPSVRRATFWRRMYREDLYAESRFEDHMRKKLFPAQEVARKEVDEIMRVHGVQTLMLNEDTRGLADAPTWGGNARWFAAYADQGLASFWAIIAERRRRYWLLKRGCNKWARYWELRHIALSALRASWPVSAEWVLRAEQWEAADEDRRRRQAIESEAEEARREVDAARAEATRERDVNRQAETLLAEIIPGAQVQKRMRKAQAFDVLVTLLEKANVDEETKAAIGKLRGVVEGERGKTPRVSGRAVKVAPGTHGKRHPKGNGSLPLAAG